MGPRDGVRDVEAQAATTRDQATLKPRRRTQFIEPRANGQTGTIIGHSCHTRVQLNMHTRFRVPNCVYDQILKHSPNSPRISMD